MSLVLLIGAGLFLRTLDNLRSVDVGFDPKNLLMFNVNPASIATMRSAGAVVPPDAGRLSAVPGVRPRDDAHALLSGSTSTSSMWTQGQTCRPPPKEHAHDERLAGVLRDDGDPGAAGRAFTDHDGTTRAEGGDRQRGRGAKAVPDGTHSAAGSAARSRRTASSRSSASCATRSTRTSAIPAPPTLYRCVWQQPRAA